MSPLLPCVMPWSTSRRAPSLRASVIIVRRVSWMRRRRSSMRSRSSRRRTRLPPQLALPDPGSHGGLVNPDQLRRVGDRQIVARIGVGLDQRHDALGQGGPQLLSDDLLHHIANLRLDAHGLSPFTLAFSRANRRKPNRGAGTAPKCGTRKRRAPHRRSTRRNRRACADTRRP